MFDDCGHFRDFGNRWATAFTMLMDESFAVCAVDTLDCISDNVTLLLLNVFTLRSDGFQHLFRAFTCWVEVVLWNWSGTNYFTFNDEAFHNLISSNLSRISAWSAASKNSIMEGLSFGRMRLAFFPNFTPFVSLRPKIFLIPWWNLTSWRRNVQKNPAIELELHQVKFSK